jgi:alkylmercury lyase
VDRGYVTSAGPAPGRHGRSDESAGTESLGTLKDFVQVTRAEVGAGSIQVEDLCHVSGESAHRATTDDETYHFECFHDGIALAYLAGEPVDIRTRSPSGTEIDIHATPDGDVQVTPSGAVMSFGIADEFEHERGTEPTVEAVYANICPYVKAFPSRESYQSWAAAVDGATVGLPLKAGMPIAAALTE